jgi:hypothetical protein
MDQTSDIVITQLRAAGFIVEDKIWCGYSTGRPPGPNRLKPAHYEIVMCRKPGPRRPLNIDQCRLPFVDDADRERMKRIDTLRTKGRRKPGVYETSIDYNARERTPFKANEGGRHPANVIFMEAAAGYYDRFFVIPVPRKRGDHPAQKPLRLMLYLVTLFSRPADLIVDPFAGSGTTGVAALLLGRRVLLIERERNFALIAEKNLAAARAGAFAALRFPAHSESLDEPPNQENMRNNEELTAVQERARVQISALRAARQMAAELGISERTFRRRARDKGLPCVRLGLRSVRYHRDSVLAALVANNTNGGPSDEEAQGLLFRPEGGLVGRAGVARRHQTMPEGARHGGRREGAAQEDDRGPGGGSGEASIRPAGCGAEEGRGGGSGDRPGQADNEADRLRRAADALRVFDDTVGAARRRRAKRDDS